MVLHHCEVNKEEWQILIVTNYSYPASSVPKIRKIPKFGTMLHTHGWKRPWKIVMSVRSHSLNWDETQPVLCLGHLKSRSGPHLQASPSGGCVMRLSANKPAPINPEPKGYKPGGNSNPSSPTHHQKQLFFFPGERGVGREAEVSTPQDHGSRHRCIQYCALATESPKQEGNHVAISLGSLAPALLSPTSSSSSKL